jgi:hypothetical protein
VRCPTRICNEDAAAGDREKDSSTMAAVVPEVPPEDVAQLVAAGALLLDVR